MTAGRDEDCQGGAPLSRWERGDERLRREGAAVLGVDHGGLPQLGAGVRVEREQTEGLGDEARALFANARHRDVEELRAGDHERGHGDRRVEAADRGAVGVGDGPAVPRLRVAVGETLAAQGVAAVRRSP